MIFRSCRLVFLLACKPALAILCAVHGWLGIGVLQGAWRRREKKKKELKAPTCFDPSAAGLKQDSRLVQETEFAGNKEGLGRIYMGQGTPLFIDPWNGVGARVAQDPSELSVHGSGTGSLHFIYKHPAQMPT